MKSEMSMNADGTGLLLNISGQFGAAELQALVLELGRLRKGMKPAVPRLNQDNSATQVSCTSETLSEFGAEKPDQQGNCHLRLRSERFGWLGWWLAHNDACQLRDFLLAYYPSNTGTHANLISQSNPKRH